MTAAEIFALMGRTVVLLKVDRQTKKPIPGTGWQNKTVADMTPGYLAGLNGETNIGILNGAPSGKLIGIEFDSLDHGKEFRKANAWVKNGLWSKGKRGPCFWVFITGDYPKNHKLYDKEGNAIGEWRADGCQTVFSGIHAEGMAYQNSGNPPATLAYADILWPETILRKKPGKPEPEHPADIHAILVAKCGQPYTVTRKGAVILNQSYFVQRFCLENLVLFEQDEGWFFTYTEGTGAWARVVPEVIKEMMRRDWERLTHLFGEPKLADKANNSLLNALTDGIKSHSGRTKVFNTLERIIHCANGMLHLDDDGWRLMPFSPEYYSRNPIAINWNPDAKAPLFEGILAAMPAYDSSLFLRYAGNILLTGNAAQSILIIVGAAGTSKSTLCELIELVMGLGNVIELRTKLLHERFEIGRYVGKTLLTGKDVKGDFLQTEGAQALKKLTGHDNMTGEIKKEMGTPRIYGNFAALITCNERLLVRLEGSNDVSAWRRRLLLISLPESARHQEVIGDYAQKVFAEEAEGILVKMVQGAFDQLAECKVKCEFTLAPEQKNRVDALLAESQSIEMFLKDRVFKQPGGEGLSTEELTTAYGEYCEEKGWAALKIEKVQRDLVNHMFQLFGTHLGNSLARNGKKARGYPGVALAGQDEDDR